MVTLYDYQEVAYQMLQKTFKNVWRALMVMATGLGKTIVSAFFAKDEIALGGRGLFLCHENDILDQALKEYRLVLGDKAVLRTFYGEIKDWQADNADVLFASFRSFNEWHQAFDKAHFDFIIVDESHHGQAPTYKEVIDYFKPKKLLGMTATPNRGDEKDIRDIFGEEVINYSLEEAIANGWLTNVEYRILHDGINNRKLKSIMRSVLQDGERVSVKQLNENIFVKMRDEEIAKIILSYNSRKTIIFCENIDHVENFAKYLPDSAVFHSRISDKHNKKILQSFRDGEKRFILSVNKFNEGIDVPEAEMIVFLRCTDSETIFRQQLGRGLRKAEGKQKVVVLDFVANVNRLIVLKELAGRISTFNNNQEFNLTKQKFFIEGENYNLIFDDQLVDLLEVLNRLNVEFYPTWQEASQAAITLGFKTGKDYLAMYKKDSRLPSHPDNYYSNFPGFGLFLNGVLDGWYATWQEASQAAIALGIKTKTEYALKYKQDFRLPSHPNRYYPDFPGFGTFFERKSKILRYSTWQEASQAAITLGIKTKREYMSKRKQDSRLLSYPDAYYKDFPGFKIFLGITKYSTWQEASQAAIALGAKTKTEYALKYKQDLRLPSDPRECYHYFPGWAVFLGGDPKWRYSTWQEASKAAIALGIKTKTEYTLKYKQDIQLPGNLNGFYSDFPGFGVFFGRKSRTRYATWQEASKAAIALEIKTKTEYVLKYKQDAKLPCNPNRYYSDFPGFGLFLGKKQPAS
ncbi:MAG: integrase repeat-containing protein [Patescibacteria group bacterium]